MISQWTEGTGRRLLCTENLKLFVNLASPRFSSPAGATTKSRLSPCVYPPSFNNFFLPHSSSDLQHNNLLSCHLVESFARTLEKNTSISCKHPRLIICAFPPPSIPNPHNRHPKHYPSCYLPSTEVTLSLIISASLIAFNHSSWAPSCMQSQPQYTSILDLNSRSSRWNFPQSRLW